MHENPYALSSGGESADRSRAPRTRCWFAWGSLATCLLLVGACNVLMYEPFTPVRAWEAAGPVHVLASEDELWIFAQADHWIHLPGRMVSVPSRVQDQHQRLTVLNQQGQVKQIPLPSGGPNLHPNISEIFRFDDTFVLFDGRRFYRWQQDHFEIIPTSEVDPALQAVQEVAPSRRMEALPAAAGWERLLAANRYWEDPVEFEWQGRRYEISNTEFPSTLYRSPRGPGETRLRALDQEENEPVLLIEFDARIHKRRRW